LRIVIHSAGGPHNPLAKLGLLHQYPTPSSTRADRKFLVLPEYSSELNRAALEWLREAKDRARRILGGADQGRRGPGFLGVGRRAKLALGAYFERSLGCR